MSFDKSWESTYSDSDGHHLNRYPYGQLVNLFFRYLKFLPDGCDNVKVLELGCGVGNNLVLFLNEGFSCYGVDGSETAIRIASERFGDRPNCHLEVMDFAHLNYDTNYFDLVVDRQSICANDSKSIRCIYGEVARVLKPGGLFISLMINTDDTHYECVNQSRGDAVKIGFNTFTDFQFGTFQGIGVIHFFRKLEVIRLCKINRLDVLALSQNKIDQLYPEKTNTMSEFILVCQKNAK